MTNDQHLDARADPSFQQHFLVAPDKLEKIIEAASIRPTDHVVELGAGAGTVARALPPCASLTVIELDDRLLDLLRENAPAAQVIHGDGIELIAGIPCDVLIGNLPNYITEKLIDILPGLSFRTAVLAVGESTDLSRIQPPLTWLEVTQLTGDDFRPPQTSISPVVQVVRNTST